MAAFSAENRWQFAEHQQPSYLIVMRDRQGAEPADFRQSAAAKRLEIDCAAATHNLAPGWLGIPQARGYSDYDGRCQRLKGISRPPRRC